MRKKKAPTAQIQTGNAVIDDLVWQLLKNPGSLIVAGNPSQAKEIEGYGVPAEDVGVLCSIRSGVAIVLDRETYDRMRAEEDKLIATMRSGGDA